VETRCGLGRLFVECAGALDYAHDVGLLHDQEVFVIDLDLAARPFAEQDAIACFQIERHDLAVLVASARTNGDDFALLRLLLGSIRDDNAALRLLFAFDAADDDAVV
jgi:hypothetical protein